MSLLRRVLALAAALGASACTRPDPPMLTLGDRVCDVQPVLDAAMPVVLDQTGGTRVKIGPGSACLQAGGRNATYAVFRLPVSPSPYTATVFSEIVGEAVIAPRATLYDDSGAVTRTVPLAEFRAGVDGYQTGLRIGPRDRLVLVAADPAMVGQRVTLRLSARETGVQLAAAVPIIIIIPNRPPPQVTAQPATISLNGQLRVSAAAIQRLP